MCERSVEVVGLAGNLHLLIRAHTVKCAHVMQTVGQFYEQCTDIIVQRVEHLFVVVNLARRCGVVLFLLFGDHIDQEGHITAETLLDILNGIWCILHHIVQEGRDDGVCTQTQLLGNNLGNRHRMHYIWLTRLATLLLMSLARQLVGVTDSRNILGRQTSCKAS